MKRALAKRDFGGLIEEISLVLSQRLCPSKGEPLFLDLKGASREISKYGGAKSNIWLCGLLPRGYSRQFYD